MQTTPIKKFYDLLKIQSLEFVFFEDGKAKSISTMLSGTLSELSLTVTNNYQGDASKYLLRDESDHSNDVIMTLKSLPKDKMKAHASASLQLVLHLAFVDLEYNDMFQCSSFDKILEGVEDKNLINFPRSSHFASTPPTIQNLSFDKPQNVDQNKKGRLPPKRKRPFV